MNTKGKYGKVTNTEIKWSIISKSVMIIIFVEFIVQLIDYPIKCASLIFTEYHMEETCIFFFRKHLSRNVRKRTFC